MGELALSMQPQTPNTKREFLPSKMPSQNSDESIFGLPLVLWLLLGLVLLVGVSVIGLYSWQRQRSDESRATTKPLNQKQVEENQERSAVHLDRQKQLKKTRDQLRDDIKSVDKQLHAIEKEAEGLATTGPPPERIQQLLTEQRKRIENGKTQLGQLTSDLNRSQVALENGREACLELIWLMKEAGRISQPLLTAVELNKLPESVSAEQMVLDELELQRQALVVNRSKQAKVKSLRLAIEKQNAKVAKLMQEWEQKQKDGTLELTPEQVVQQHVVDLKQQIGDLRLALDADLKKYRSDYEKAVKAEPAASNANVKKLKTERDKLLIKLQLVDEQIPKL